MEKNPHSRTNFADPLNISIAESQIRFDSITLETRDNELKEQTEYPNPLPNPPPRRIDSPPPNWDFEHYDEPRGKVAEPKKVGFAPNSYVDSMEMNFQTDKTSSLNISPALLAIFAYFFTWFGALIILFLEKKNLFVLFHAWQSLIMGIFMFIFQLMFVWSRTIYILLWIIYLIVIFFMIAKVIVDSETQTRTKLPFIGDFCETRAFNRVHSHYGTTDFFKL